jgi:integrative and conjugative element protein (TIGR02256 family)
MRTKSLIEPQSKRLIYLHDKVDNLIQSFWQLRPDDLEAGGILIGKRRGQHLEITVASPPQADDKRSRCKFVRSPTGHQEIADERWVASEGEENYLGEWHTHPEVNATPSELDLREWKKLARKNEEPLVFIIAGLERSYCPLPH